MQGRRGASWKPCYPPFSVRRFSTAAAFAALVRNLPRVYKIIVYITDRASAAQLPGIRAVNR
jgi:hypothetical protein